MISKLSLTDFRCFSNLSINFEPGVNLILGDNGSGKSSLIEALYLCGRGKSFRSNYLVDLIKSGSKSSFVICEFTNDLHDFSRLGCQVQSSKLLIKHNSDSVKKRSSLLDIFPLQLVTPVSHSLVDSGSSFRRKFIDWGLFHVEHNYRDDWSVFNRILKQRNQALKIKSTQARYWDSEFCHYSQKLNKLRSQYFLELFDLFLSVQSEIISEPLVSLEFKPGWKLDIGLEQDLKAHIDTDFLTGWTHVGPHKADIKFNFVKSRRNTLSRGQQKMIVFCLQLAQFLLLKNQIDANPVFLIDDIGAELDAYHLNKLFSFIANNNFQTIITSISKPSIDEELISNVFHVEHS